MNSKPLEYRPNSTVGFLFTGIFVVTAVVLVWVGFAVRAADREAMAGFTRILFTVVPIPLFSFGFALVFVFFGFRIARRTMRPRATLSVGDDNLTLPDGTLVAWEDVASVKTTKDSHLAISLTAAENSESKSKSKPTRGRWLNHDLEPDSVVMSSFELGADPLQVKEEVERRMRAHQEVSPLPEKRGETQIDAENQFNSEDQADADEQDTGDS